VHGDEWWVDCTHHPAHARMRLRPPLRCHLHPLHRCLAPRHCALPRPLRPRPRAS
jgi:hypothetical protein